MTYSLYLDDIRNPTTDRDWVVARDFAQAVDIVCKNGYPSFCSFDHDLGDEVPTGHDFAKWLVERDLEHHDMPDDFGYNVHSANPPGAANIKGVLDSYMAFKSFYK